MPFVWKLKPISFWWATYTGVKTSNRHGNVRNWQCTNVLARQTNLVNTCSCSHDPRTVLTNTKENYWNVSQIASLISWAKWFQARLIQREHGSFPFPVFLICRKFITLGALATKYEMLRASFEGSSVSTVTSCENKDQAWDAPYCWRFPRQICENEFHV